MAEAPSFRISARSTAINGTSEAVSTKETPSLVWAAVNTWRRPFNSTSVEPTPSPRRLMLEVPVVWFWVKASGLFWAPVLIVSVWVRSAMFCAPIASMSAAVTVCSGEAKSACDFVRR